MRGRAQGGYRDNAVTPELAARTLRNVSPRILAPRWARVYLAVYRYRFTRPPWDRHAVADDGISPAVLNLLARRWRAADKADAEPWGFRAWEDGLLVGNLTQFEMENAARHAGTDSRIGAIKEMIDTLNHRRTERINNIDHWFHEYGRWQQRERGAVAGTRWRCIESPGSVLDRLSILFIKTRGKMKSADGRVRAVKMWRGLLADWGAYLRALKQGEATFRCYGGIQKEYGR